MQYMYSLHHVVPSTARSHALKIISLLLSKFNRNRNIFEFLLHYRTLVEHYSLPPVKFSLNIVTPIFYNFHTRAKKYNAK